MNNTVLHHIEVDPFLIFADITDDGSVRYAAGFPGFPANFSRDVIKAGIIAGRPDVIRQQIGISAMHQGSQDDPLTGEQIGKIHHEYPGAALVGRREGLTTYNACDTTPLFLIAVEGLMHQDTTEFEKVTSKFKSNVEIATSYIISQIGPDNLFWDTPPKGADGYVLRVTYWKDSDLPHANGKKEPLYPISFAQAHFIAARGLLSAGKILNRADLAEKADKMFKAGITEFFGNGSFTVYKDAEGKLQQTSSDELHSLAYIPTDYSDLLPLKNIRKRAQELATVFGYMCTPYEIAMQLSDKYHGNAVWVFEQAMIHYGATKFGLLYEAETASYIAPHINSGQELYSISIDESGAHVQSAAGNGEQLWSVAARIYFEGETSLSKLKWL